MNLNMSSSCSEIISSIIAADKELFASELDTIITEKMRDFSEKLRAGVQKNLEDSLKKFYCIPDEESLEKEIFSEEFKWSFTRYHGDDVSNITDKYWTTLKKNNEDFRKDLSKGKLMCFCGKTDESRSRKIYFKSYIINQSYDSDGRSSTANVMKNPLPLNIMYIIKKCIFGGNFELIKEKPYLLNTSSIEFEKVCKAEYASIESKRIQMEEQVEAKRVEMEESYSSKRAYIEENMELLTNSKEELAKEKEEFEKERLAFTEMQKRFKVQLEHLETFENDKKKFEEEKEELYEKQNKLEQELDVLAYEKEEFERQQRIRIKQVDSIYEERMRILNENKEELEKEKAKLKLVKMKLDKMKVQLDLEREELNEQKREFMAIKAENLDLDEYFDR
jgi:hypothetical protein